MRNIHNAVADVIAHLEETGIRLEQLMLYQDPNNERRYVIRLRQRNIPNSHLEIEVMEEDDGSPFAAVLDRNRISSATMTMFMEDLMERLQR